MSALDEIINDMPSLTDSGAFRQIVITRGKLNQAAAELAELRTKIKAQDAALEEARESKKWISVDNYMPENCVSVLVCFENSCRDDLMAIAWLDRSLWWLNPNHTLDRNYEHVTYWMPLPKLPDEAATHPTPPAQADGK